MTKYYPGIVVPGTFSYFLLSYPKHGCQQMLAPMRSPCTIPSWLVHSYIQSQTFGLRGYYMPHLSAWRFESIFQSPHPSQVQPSLSGNPLGTETEGESSSLTQAAKVRRLRWAHAGMLTTPLWTSPTFSYKPRLPDWCSIAQSCFPRRKRPAHLSNFDLGNMDGTISGGAQDDTTDALLTKVRC